jgi:hypothetical protein
LTYTIGGYYISNASEKTWAKVRAEMAIARTGLEL